MSYLMRQVRQCPSSEGGRGQQFLKVLKSNLWVVIPWLNGIPHRWWWLIAGNTVLVDENPTKSVVNPFGTIIFPNT